MTRDDTELRELTQALTELDLTYHKVRGLLTKEIRRHQREIGDNNQTEERTLFPDFSFRLHERVTICNPKPNRQNSGVIVGHTGHGDRGFIKVRANDGKIIDRGPQNLRRL